jgi:CDP-diacylglycerol--glycerol-3-phosphate 3-phosphatidyltransferase
MFDKQPDLSTYYHDLLKLISHCSYQLTPSLDSKYALTMHKDIADPVKESRKYKRQVNQRLEQFIQHHQNKQNLIEPKQEDTAVLPVIQMGPFHIRQDERLTLELLNIAHRQQSWTIHLTSGYFNFTDKYKSFILKTRARFRFLTASPEANGFFNSKGVSRFLPPAYTFIERKFYRQVKRAGRQDEISIEEYKRAGWTYHAKGLWVSLNERAPPSVTMIGSPNFGQRSSERDLEAQALVITKNENLRQALHKVCNIYILFNIKIMNIDFFFLLGSGSITSTF